VVFDDGQCRNKHVASWYMAVDSAGINAWLRGIWWWAVLELTRGLWYSMMGSAGINAWLVVYGDGQC